MRFLVLLLVLAAPASAQEWAERGHNVSGRPAVRLAMADTPLGVRYFWQERYGADAAIGFSLGTDSDTAVNLEGGFLYSLAPGERVNFFLRPGLGFQSAARDSLTLTTVSFSLSTELEFFATQDLSFSAGVGVSLASVSGSGDSTTRISTFRDLWGRAAVQYYLPN